MALNSSGELHNSDFSSPANSYEGLDDVAQRVLNDLSNLGGDSVAAQTQEDDRMDGEAVVDDDGDAEFQDEAGGTGKQNEAFICALRDVVKDRCVSE